MSPPTLWKCSTKLVEYSFSPTEIGVTGWQQTPRLTMITSDTIQSRNMSPNIHFFKPKYVLSRHFFVCRKLRLSEWKLMSLLSAYSSQHAQVRSSGGNKHGITYRDLPGFPTGFIMEAPCLAENKECLCQKGAVALHRTV